MLTKIITRDKKSEHTILIYYTQKYINVKSVVDTLLQYNTIYIKSLA
jgi:hypothetical protein